MEILCLIWLVMAISATAQNDSNAPVLDTKGKALQRGVKYYIKPAITDVGGPFTLINRNGMCPFYVGQQNVSGLNEKCVTFEPYVKREKVIKEGKNLKIKFSGVTTCAQSTTWMVSEKDPESKRRLIATGDEKNHPKRGQPGNYFNIIKEKVGNNIYSLQWCPTEICPVCRFICGSVGSLVDNGKRFAALDGSALPVVFVRA